MADGGKVLIHIDGESKGFQSAMNKAGSIAKTAAKGIAIGAGAAATAIGAIGTQAVKAYADYEQLVGGVETLFKQSANVVQNYANQAYQTAGMSANQYMETVTSFSASLLQSLKGDTASAAEYANQAVVDMSDNANKMGTSIEMIQNAYQGFAKQNYTMLDNLKLGYGGTKEEMLRLVNDAAKLDSSIKANDLSFANIVKSIHAVQTEMGITGTTYKEAATTIQGSLSMVKASWENLMTGLADPSQNIDELIDNLINSLETFASNILPRITDTLNGIGTAIEKLLPKILDKAISGISAILPELTQSAVKLLSSFASALSSNANKISVAALKIGTTLVKGIIQIIPQLVQAGAQIIGGIYEGIMGALPQLGTIGTMIVAAFAADKILTIVTSVVTAFQTTAGAVAAYTAAITTANSAIIANQSASVLLASTLTPLQLAFGVLTGQISLATAAQVAFQAVMSIDPVYLFAAAVATLIAGIAAACVAYDNYIEQNSEAVIATQEMADAAVDSAEKMNSVIDSLNNLHETAQTSITDAEASAYANGILADELYDLAGKTSLTAAEKERMAAIVDQLNSSVSGLNLEFDKETGILNKTKEAVDELIQKNLELAKANAIQDLYTEMLKDVYKAQGEATTAAQKLKEAQEELNKIQSEGIEKEVTKQGTTQKYIQYTREQQKAMENLRNAIETYSDELANADSSVQNSFDNMQNIATAAGVDLPASFDTAKSSSKDFFDSLKTSSDEAKGASKKNGEDFGEGYAKGIESKNERSYNAGKTLAQRAVQGTKDGQDSNSPAKETIKLGKFFDLGYAIGIERYSNKAVKSATEMVGDVLEATKKLTEDSRTEVQKVLDDMNEDMLESEKAYQDELKRIEEEEYQEKLKAATSQEEKQKLINERAQKEKLELLKDTAEKERKIYDATQKDIENSQDKISESIENLAETAKESLKEVEKAQESFKKKLTSFGALYGNATLTSKDGSIKFPILADLSEGTKMLKNYQDALLKVKNRGDLPQEFFKVMRDMSVEEGTKFANLLLNLNDDAFNKYINDWKEKQSVSDSISKMLYADETSAAKQEVIDAFEQFNDDMEAQGGENAKAWGNGFIEKVREIMPKLVERLNESYSNLLPYGPFAYEGAGGTFTTNVSNFYLQPPKDASVQEQIWEANNAAWLEKQRGN